MGKDLDPSKVRAARAAADLVESGMVVGLGTGSTAALMVRRLGERREQDGLKIIGVPTSEATAELACHLSIPLRELDDISSLDMNLDGADEVDPQFRMIKGLGGGLAARKDCRLRRRTPRDDHHHRQARRSSGGQRSHPRRGQSRRAEAHRAAASKTGRKDQHPPAPKRCTLPDRRG